MELQEEMDYVLFEHASDIVLVNSMTAQDQRQWRMNVGGIHSEKEVCTAMVSD